MYIGPWQEYVLGKALAQAKLSSDSRPATAAGALSDLPPICRVPRPGSSLSAPSAIGGGQAAVRPQRVRQVPPHGNGRGRGSQLGKKQQLLRMQQMYGLRGAGPGVRAAEWATGAANDTVHGGEEGDETILPSSHTRVGLAPSRLPLGSGTVSHLPALNRADEVGAHLLGWAPRPNSGGTHALEPSRVESDLSLPYLEQALRSHAPHVSTHTAYLPISHLGPPGPHARDGREPDAGSGSHRHEHGGYAPGAYGGSTGPEYGSGQYGDSVRYPCASSQPQQHSSQQHGWLGGSAHGQPKDGQWQGAHACGDALPRRCGPHSAATGAACHLPQATSSLCAASASPCAHASSHWQQPQQHAPQPWHEATAHGACLTAAGQLPYIFAQPPAEPYALLHARAAATGTLGSASAPPPVGAAAARVGVCGSRSEDWSHDGRR